MNVITRSFSQINQRFLVFKKIKKMFDELKPKQPKKKSYRPIKILE